MIVEKVEKEETMRFLKSNWRNKSFFVIRDRDDGKNNGYQKILDKDYPDLDFDKYNLVIIK